MQTSVVNTSSQFLVIFWALQENRSLTILMLGVRTQIYLFIIIMYIIFVRVLLIHILLALIIIFYLIHSEFLFFFVFDPFIVLTISFF
jgi:hypothetical protein